MSFFMENRPPRLPGLSTSADASQATPKWQEVLPLPIMLITTKNEMAFQTIHNGFSDRPHVWRNGDISHSFMAFTAAG
jgi:hypothetical protein